MALRKASLGNLNFFVLPLIVALSFSMAASDPN